MKKIILITSLFSFASWANNSSQALQVSVDSRTIQINKSEIKNNAADRQMPPPNRHQTVLTKNANGSFSAQCKQKHNHELDKVLK